MTVIQFSLTVCALRYIPASETFNDESGRERLAFVLGHGATVGAALIEAAATNFGDTCDKQPLEKYLPAMIAEIRDEWLGDPGMHQTIFTRLQGADHWQPYTD